MKVSKKIALLVGGLLWFAAAPMAVAADDAPTIRANTDAWFKAFNAAYGRHRCFRPDSSSQVAEAPV